MHTSTTKHSTETPISPKALKPQLPLKEAKVTQTKQQLDAHKQQQLSLEQKDSEQLGQHMKMDCLLYVTTTQLQIIWEKLQWEHSIVSHLQLSILLTGLGLRLARPVEAFHCRSTCRLWSKKETSLYQRYNSLKHQIFVQHLIYALQQRMMKAKCKVWEICNNSKTKRVTS